MAHTFTVTLPANTDINSGVAQVRKGIEDAGGSYAFDGKNGSFSVKGVVGKFTLTGRDVTITIEKKPFIVSNGFVEKTIRGYMA